jgi:hypothetical protein
VLETGTLDVGQQSPVLLKHECREDRKKKILLLGSSNRRIIGSMLKENLGIKFDIVSIFKPNAPLAKVVEDLGKLGKGLTKQDHIVIVGGPGNSLDRNHLLSRKGCQFHCREDNQHKCGTCQPLQ